MDKIKTNQDKLIVCVQLWGCPADPWEESGMEELGENVRAVQLHVSLIDQSEPIPQRPCEKVPGATELWLAWSISVLFVIHNLEWL